MKTRKLSRLLSLFLVLSLLPIVGLGVAGAAPLGQETYTVQKDDTLWNIAEKYLGSGAGYPAIVDATNKKHAEDPTFPDIVNPGVIQPGWKLAIPSAEEAEGFMACYVSLAAGASGKITLYTSVPLPIAEKIQADFQAKFPEITLDVFRAGTSEVVDRIMREKETGSIQADVIWVAEPSTYEDFKDQDMLLKYTPPESVFMPSEMKDPEGYYYAGRLINMIVGYNTAITTPPKGWQDLSEPGYRDKLGFVSAIDLAFILATRLLAIERSVQPFSRIPLADSRHCGPTDIQGIHDFFVHPPCICLEQYARPCQFARLFCSG